LTFGTKRVLVKRDNPFLIFRSGFLLGSFGCCSGFFRGGLFTGTVFVAAFLLAVVFFLGLEAGVAGVTTVVGLGVRFGRDEAAVRSMGFLGAMILSVDTSVPPKTIVPFYSTYSALCCNRSVMEVTDFRIWVGARNHT
ncbi:hypothetical protein KCV03_g327, partial [Aureobasidium melanogenum]